MVKNLLAEPSIQRSIQDERAELSVLCKDKGRDIFMSIHSGDIEKANLLQKATAGAILIDKALLLAGEATSINVSVLLDVAHAIRARQDADSERQQQQAKARLSVPANPALGNPSPQGQRRVVGLGVHRKKNA